MEGCQALGRLHARARGFTHWGEDLAGSPADDVDMTATALLHEDGRACLACAVVASGLSATELRSFLDDDPCGRAGVRVCWDCGRSWFSVDWLPSPADPCYLTSSFVHAAPAAN